MRLARLELKEIGPFEDAVFELPEPGGRGELVLFEGPNGSGKTTIVQVIALAAAAGGNWEVLGAPWTELVRRIRSASGLARARVEHLLESVTTELAPAQPQMSLGPPDVEIHARLSQFAAASMSRDVTPWAAFAFRGHVHTATLGTEGPKEIFAHPLQGALSFGADTRSSSHLGQLLINLEYDRIQAKLYASERDAGEKRPPLEDTAASRARSLARFTHMLSRVTDRRVDIEFGVGVRTPRLLFDGTDIPVDLLGEGLRNTVSWLGDLFFRLERTPWASPETSPFDQDFWLILDEIEESLHPTMQSRILPALREIFPNAHIYATTHSPFVVASAGEGVVFPIRPDRDHLVRGKVEPRPLEPGQSLEWVTTEIFQARSGFVDERSRSMLEEHKREVRRFQRTGTMDWDAFLSRRAELMRLNDEVRTIVAMQEVPVRTEVDRQMLARDTGREAGAAQ